VGERLFAFDLLEFQDQDIRSVPYSQRLAHLASLGLDGAIVVIPTAKTAGEKRQLYDTLQSSGVEGIVFKKQDAPYSAGRPNSGGNQRKYKFYDTASVIVTKINDKSSIAVAVYEGDKLVNVGNVTIPPNKAMPAPNAVVEVRYLYAYPGGSLYQPTYLGVRDDIGADDCGIDQLKYKKSE
jgi:bifunctional non-homologous end joining protein LigD